MWIDRHIVPLRRATNSTGQRPIQPMGRAALQKSILMMGASQLVRSIYRCNLHLAALGGNVDEVAELLNDGFDVNALDPFRSTTALHDAVERGHIDVISILVDRGADVEAKNGSGYTPLHEAILAQKLDCCRRLIEKGANPNARTGNDWPLLHVACEACTSIEIPKVLLDAGADIDAVSAGGRSALHLVCEGAIRRPVRCCELLLAKGCRVDIRDSQGWTPLHRAIYHGHVELCRLLVSNGADTSARITARHVTPLHLAVIYDLRDVFELLLDNGADANAADCNKSTPLHHAIRLDNAFMVESLVETYNADPNSRDDNGMSCLHLAAHYGNDRVILSILGPTRRKPIDLEDVCDGLTPLHFAAKGGHEHAVRALLAHGARFNAPAGESRHYALHGAGKTPLDLATDAGHEATARVLELAEQLLQAAASDDKAQAESLAEQRAAVNARDCSDGKTALHHAVGNANVQLVDYLLSRGARIDKATGDGQTALHLSLVLRDYRLVQVIMGHAQANLFGVDLCRFLDAKTVREGDTALHMAARLGQLDIVKSLVAAGAAYDMENECGLIPAGLAQGEALRRYFRTVNQFATSAMMHDINRMSKIIEREPSVAYARGHRDGRTALFRAIQVHRILRASGTVRERRRAWIASGGGETVLHAASSSGDAGVIDGLIAEHGDDPRFVDAKTLGANNTALHLASSVAVARKLLNNGACKDSKNSAGKRPADIAVDAEVRALLTSFIC